MTHYTNTDNPIDFPQEPEFDIVIYTLEEKIRFFRKITQGNINADMFNIMDQIRLEQIEELKQAIKLWKEKA